MPSSFQPSAFNYDVNGPRIDVQVFRISGIWTKPAGAKFVRICAWGGGGGGGGGVTKLTPAAGTAATGGGGGARVQFWSAADFLPNQIFVTVGAGGVGGTGGSNNTNGATGGTSSFGNVVSAYGGGGGYKARSSWFDTFSCSIAGGTGGGVGGPGQNPSSLGDTLVWKKGLAGGLPSGTLFGGSCDAFIFPIAAAMVCNLCASYRVNQSRGNNLGYGGGGYPGYSNNQVQGAYVRAGGSEWGGGAGGGTRVSSTAVTAGGGGYSLYGGSGGAAGGPINPNGVLINPANGGRYYGYGACASNVVTGNQGLPGSNGTTQVTGSGSGGQGGNPHNTSAGGGRGGNGGFPSGGAGGGGSTVTSCTNAVNTWPAGDGGQGGDGQVIIYSW